MPFHRHREPERHRTGRRKKATAARYGVAVPHQGSRPAIASRGGFRLTIVRLSKRMASLNVSGDREHAIFIPLANLFGNAAEIERIPALSSADTRCADENHWQDRLLRRGGFLCHVVCRPFRVSQN